MISTPDIDIHIKYFLRLKCFVYIYKYYNYSEIKLVYIFKITMILWEVTLKQIMIGFYELNEQEDILYNKQMHENIVSDDTIRRMLY